VNEILSSFDADVAQFRDMRLNRLIFYPSPDLKVVLHTVSKRSATTAFTYLPERVDLHDKQTYSILILYAGYTMNSSRISHVIYAYLKNVLSLAFPLLRTS
jgi:hypothetical protein